MADTASATGGATDVGVDLPSARELELEVFLGERDEQIIKLVNEIKLLRRQVYSQPLPNLDQESPSPESDAPIVLPPSILDILAPRVSSSDSVLVASAGNQTASTTITAALTTRLAALQEENDEMYNLLKSGTVGKVYEEVHLLKHHAKKLEAALKESHTMIESLKTELGEAYRAIESQSSSNRQDSDTRSLRGAKRRHHSRSQSSSHTPPTRSGEQVPPAPSHHTQRQQNSSTSQQLASSKPIPTGPRAQKKPRLDSEDEQDKDRPRPDERNVRADELRINGAASRSEDSGSRVDQTRERGRGWDTGKARDWDEQHSRSGRTGRSYTGTNSNRSDSPPRQARGGQPRETGEGGSTGRRAKSRSPPTRLRSVSPSQSRSGPRSPDPQHQTRGRVRSPTPGYRERESERERERRDRDNVPRRSRSPSRIGRQARAVDGNSTRNRDRRSPIRVKDRGGGTNGGGRQTTNPPKNGSSSKRGGGSLASRIR